jgi:hypothetical protein
MANIKFSQFTNDTNPNSSSFFVGYNSVSNLNVRVSKANLLSSLGAITGTGTTNYLPKFTGASALGNSVIYDDGTNIGLGTSTPSQKLEIVGNILVRNTLTNASFYLAQEGDNSSTLYQYNNGTLKNVLATNGVSYITGGNVGIGTTTPATKLDIVGSDSTQFGALRLYNSEGSGGTQNSVSLLMQVRNSISNLPSVKLIAQEATNDSNLGELIIQTSNDESATLSEVVRIAQNGAGGSRFIRMASGTGGIQFNGDTASANALDDYEEGTFTATITPSTSGTITSSASFTTWSYTKIGRQVTINGVFVISAISSPIGKAIIVGGLPFTILNSNSNFGAFSATIYSAAIDDDIVLSGRHAINTTQLTIGKNASTIIVNDEIYVTATYFV